jgi:hypothetical protein
MEGKDKLSVFLPFCLSFLSSFPFNHWISFMISFYVGWQN